MSQTCCISMKLYPNYLYIILFTETLPLVKNSQQYLLTLAKNPEKWHFFNKLPTVNSVISFSLPWKSSNFAKRWPEVSWLISENFVQSGFSYLDLWRFKKMLKNCFFGIIVQYAQAGTVKEKTYLAETETWVNF